MIVYLIVIITIVFDRKHLTPPLLGECKLAFILKTQEAFTPKMKYPILLPMNALKTRLEASRELV